MVDRNQTLWSLLVTLAVLLILVCGIKIYPMVSHWNRVKSRSAKVQFGTDKQLESEIEYLENRLKERSEYKFKLDNEPLRLSNVLYFSNGFGSGSHYSSGKIRVSAVILGTSENQAILKYHDTNYTVTVGDTIDKYIVKWIDAEEVVVADSDKEIHYPVITSDVQNEGVQKDQILRREN